MSTAAAAAPSPHRLFSPRALDAHCAHARCVRRWLLSVGFSQLHWMRYVRQAVRRPSKRYTLSDIATHTDPTKSVWMAIRGQVYDVTAYMRYHPGGIPQLMKGAGKDCTKIFGQWRTMHAREPENELAMGRCESVAIVSSLDLSLSRCFPTDKIHPYVNLEVMMAPLVIGTLVKEK